MEWCECPECRGDGEVPNMDYPIASSNEFVVCSCCDGKGRILDGGGEEEAEVNP